MESTYTPTRATIDYILSRFSTARMAQRMAISGKRFSKDFRHGVTLPHRLVYRMVGSTVLLNVAADNAVETVARMFAAAR